MIQKTQSPATSQPKRTHHSSTPYEEATETESNIEQLISRIQSSIIQTSDSMKQQLASFEEQELISYKNDLLKTQEEFLKIRASLNEDAIKSSILKEKAQVEKRFNVQIKKSMEMNAKYEHMKRLVKNMNQDGEELILEINYIKKKIERETKEGLMLDEELRDIQAQKTQKPQKRASKMNEERKLFTELVNKCEKSHQTKKELPEDRPKTNVVQNHQKKMEKKLKYEISNLKDYIENIPLQLNFVESKLYELIKDSFEQTRIKVEEEVTEENEQDLELDDEKENAINEEEKGSDEKEKKTTKLPSITSMNALEVKGIKSNKNQENCQKIISPKVNPKPSKAKPVEDKGKTVQKSNSSKQSEQIPSINQLSRTSVYLQEILSDPQMKEYLYNILFEGMAKSESTE